MLFFLATVSLILVAWITWRLLNRILNLPCPFWMDWLMETPYMTWVLSTEETIARADIQKGHHVLDLGCGSGRISIPAAKIVGNTGKVVAVDLQRGMIRKLKAKSDLDPELKIETQVGEFVDLDFGSVKFDRILLVMVLGELSDREAAFRKIKTILKPHGIVSISEVFPDPHFQRRKKIKSLAENNNLKEIFFSGSNWAFTSNLISINRI